MNAHESIRSMLTLAAAGALSPEDLQHVDQHVRECEVCRRELQAWGGYAAGLRQLPQPVASADLIERTQARIMRERADAAARRWNGLTLSSLGLFSCVASFAFWMMARVLTDGMLEVLGTNLVNAGPWFIVSSVVAVVTTGTAALMLNSRRVMRRV